MKGQTVYLRNKITSGESVRHNDYPRSYIVETEGGGKLQRNSIHLTPFQTAPQTISTQSGEITEQCLTSTTKLVRLEDCVVSLQTGVWLLTENHMFYLF